jgi:hypothetical protein
MVPEGRLEMPQVGAEAIVGSSHANVSGFVGGAGWGATKWRGLRRKSLACAMGVTNSPGTVCGRGLSGSRTLVKTRQEC